jgi:hypothetical protein
VVVVVEQTMLRQQDLGVLAVEEMVQIQATLDHLQLLTPAAAVVEVGAKGQVELVVQV